MNLTAFNLPTRTTVDDLASRWSIWADQEVTHGLEATMARSGLYDTAAIATVVELAGVLDSTIGATGDLVASVETFLATDCGPTERLNRWATLRIVEKHFKIPGRALIRPSEVRPAKKRPRRLLTGAEQGLVRHCSRTTPAKTAIIGAFDSLLASGELPTLFARHVQVDGTGTAETIQAMGTEHETTCGYPVAMPRTCDIASWCRPAFTHLIGFAVDDQPLVYGGAAEDHATIQSAILMNVKTVFTDAGLVGDPTVKPLSIRNTAAKALYEQVGIEATTKALGHWDLTAVAREIGAMPRR